MINLVYFNSTYGSALPVNSSGQLDPNGTLNSVESIFPTVMAIFGFTFPSQQITEFSTIKAAIKG